MNVCSLCQTNLSINTLHVVSFSYISETSILLLRDTSLPTLNTALFPISGITNTEIRQGAHAVQASAYAYRYAS